jgi:hypothetical protein
MGNTTIIRWFLQHFGGSLKPVRAVESGFVLGGDKQFRLKTEGGPASSISRHLGVGSIVGNWQTISDITV